MLDQIARTAAVAVFLVSALPCAKAQELLDSRSGQQLLLLSNGEIFEGKITLSGDIYTIEQPGAQVRFARANVELVCNNLEEAYRHKRAAIQVGNVHHHLELAQWCLRNKLYGPAAVELADATVVDPRNPKIEALQHRLKMAIELPGPSEPKTAMTGPSTDELDRMIRGLPRGVVETFTQSVQPVLLNNCANGGCHGPQSTTSLKLFHVSSNKSSSRRITQRNLYGVLQFVDASNPTASALLKAASSPHGTVRYAVFNERQASQYQRLVDWANQIGRPTGPESPEPTPPGSGIAESRSDVPGVLSVQEAKRARRMAVADPRYGDRRVGYGVAASKYKAGDVAPASFEEPANPLDPEAFNRRYAPAAPAKNAPEKIKKQEKGAP
jgi:hypothetical protein